MAFQAPGAGAKFRLGNEAETYGELIFVNNLVNPNHDPAAGREFFSRPALRAFVTYANWSDGLRGFVGGTPYANKTSGLTYGVQVETWW